jgi:hypothetical protein
MSGSSGDSSQTSTIKTGPPDYLKPYVTGAAADAQRLYQAGGPQVFPGSTVANLSPETTQAWGGIAGRATSGSPLNAAAGGYLAKAIGGQYLPGPGLDPVSASVWGQVRPNVDSAFSAAGRYGSDSHAEALAQGFTQGFAPYALQEYQGERQLQQQAAAMAPGQAAQDYVDLNALQGVGTARDQYGQALVTDAYNRFNAQQQRPYSNLDWYSSQLNGSPWQRQTSSTPVYQPGLGQQIAGGALAGLGTLAKAWSPFG